MDALSWRILPLAIRVRMAEAIRDECLGRLGLSMSLFDRHGLGTLTRRPEEVEARARLWKAMHEQGVPAAVIARVTTGRSHATVLAGLERASAQPQCTPFADAASRERHSTPGISQPAC